ncbi:hypothetical protein ACHAXT_007995 [Thalassiosira profunda]
MMQRKNKRQSQGGGGGYGSGYESNDTNNGAFDPESSSPSKPPSKPDAGGISIASLTGGGSNRPGPIERKPSKGSKAGHTRKASKVTLASVKRNFCGTQPFDKHWLNLDCCGLICAGVTYCLHIYGVYAFGWILLPPWFSVMDEDGYRELSFGCHFHRFAFISVAALAVFAHFKAMTTDPGAVPPDATPVPELEDAELNHLIKGESSPNGSPSRGQQPQQSQHGSLMQESSSSLMEEDRSLLDHSENGNGANNGNGHGLPQAVAAAGAVGAAVVGGAVAVGAAAMASGVGAAAMGAAASAGGVPVQPRAGPPAQQQRGRRMCRRCQAFKPPRAHHCSICKRCIIKMDHHCPWVNNCVGIGNHKYFLLFIFYTSLSCAYSFVFIIYRFFHCIGNSHGHQHLGPRCVDHPTDLLPLVGLTVEALLFGLFTLCMMVDQWDVVMTNLTHIDRLKGETHHHHHGYGQQQHQGYGQLPPHMTPHYNPQRAASLMKRAGVHEVFGTGRSAASRFHYSWLSPLHKVCFPDHVRDDIFGYCRPCGSSASQQESRRSVQGMEMVGRGDISAEEIV